MYARKENAELTVHHEGSKEHIYNSEGPIEKILEFFETKKINPFPLDSQSLTNIVTNQLVHPEMVSKILNIFDDGILSHEKFVDDRFVFKSKNLLFQELTYHLLYQLQLQKHKKLKKKK